jgi:N-acetylmuramoyl-L-alanine amidase
MLILLDPAHGHNTPGKRSPDGTLLEYAYTRDLANQILATLQTKGHNAQLLVPETEDIPLKERVRRTNAQCQAHGKSNVILISIHVNVAGNGTNWLNATGWSCYTTKCQTQSDTLATCLYQSAIKNFPGRRIRKDYSDSDSDWEENFYLLRKTLCPAEQNL